MINTKLCSALLLLFVILFASCQQRERPHSMDLFEADSIKKGAKLPVPHDRTLTLLLGANNKVVYFLGNEDKPLEGPNITGYGKDSLGKVLATHVNLFKDTSKYLVVFVKPSDKSTYQNFIATINLINVSGVKSYGVVDITPKETALLAKIGAY